MLKQQLIQKIARLVQAYSDPSVFSMIGWRGMIIETDDRDSYIEISNYEEDM